MRGARSYAANVPVEVESIGEQPVALIHEGFVAKRNHSAPEEDEDGDEEVAVEQVELTEQRLVDVAAPLEVEVRPPGEETSEHDLQGIADLILVLFCIKYL